MTHFSRTFPIDCLSNAVLAENGWFSDLLRHWRPAGDAADPCPDNMEGVLARERVTKGELQHLRVAFRNGYMNFYRAGQSIAKVRFRFGELQAKIHNKYIYGDDGTGQGYVTLTSKGFPDLKTGQLVPYNGLNEWISYANGHTGDEKRFVDLVVAHNPDVIDLEMGLPAHSGENRAPRMDLVAIEPWRDWWRVVFWEAKLVGDGRARCKGSDLPKVVGQLQDYTAWLKHGDELARVGKAYQYTCRMLVELHAVASRLGPDIGELGPGIRAVAASDAPPLCVDQEPRLLVLYDEENESFTKNRHFHKLVDAGLRVKTVETLSDIVLYPRT